jgi:hypothetical protein
MLVWGLRNRRPSEVAGQVFRIFGAATKTWAGLVPSGNTGGTNISPFRPLPIEPNFLATIEAAEQSRP